MYKELSVSKLLVHKRYENPKLSNTQNNWAYHLLWDSVLLIFLTLRYEVVPVHADNSLESHTS